VQFGGSIRVLTRKKREKFRINLRSVFRSRSIGGLVLCLPTLLIFGTFFLLPTLVALYLSFTKWDGFTLRPEFIGLANYVELVHDERFWNDLLITSLVWFAVVFVQLPFALLLAIGLSKQAPLMKYFRSIFFFPQIMSVTVVALTWRFAYSPSTGFINKMLEVFGLGSLTTPWLGLEQTALPAVVFSFIWWTYGMFVTMFIAGLSNIPPEYYEAARLETNRWYHELWFVTLPMLRETLLITFTMGTALGFGQSVGYFNLLTMGGPAGTTEVLGLYAINKAFRGRLFGYASALTTTLVLIILALVITPVIRIARERVEYL